MNLESHSDYMSRKLAEARDIALSSGQVAAAAAKRKASMEELAEARIVEEKRIASLSPEEKAKEKMDRRIARHGVHIKTGNLLKWTDGKSTAAFTSRYNQAIRLKHLKLSLDEAEEAYQVVQELIKVFRSQPNQLKRLRVTSLELKQYIARVKKENQDAKLRAKRIFHETKERNSDVFDKNLAAELITAIETARNSSGGYVYLKQWTLSDGSRWLKIGITNNLNRRDVEQNVLPVPAVTLKLMEVQSMDQAAAIERALHQQLTDWKVTGAGNRELFHLDDAQLAAVIAAMDF